MFSAQRVKRISLIVGILVCAISLCGLQSQETLAQTPSEEAHESILGVFEGITPCSNVIRPAPQIPADAKCEINLVALTDSAPRALRIAPPPGMPGCEGHPVAVKAGDMLLFSGKDIGDHARLTG